MRRLLTPPLTGPGIARRTDRSIPRLTLALIGATYPKDERAGAIGVWASALALTSAAGPIAGRWLTGRFGW